LLFYYLKDKGEKMDKYYIEDIVKTAFLQIEDEMSNVKTNQELIYFNQSISEQVKIINAYIHQITIEIS